MGCCGAYLASRLHLSNLYYSKWGLLYANRSWKIGSKIAVECLIVESLDGRSQQGGNNDSCKILYNSFKQITDERMILHSKLIEQNIDMKIYSPFILILNLILIETLLVPVQ